MLKDILNKLRISDLQKEVRLVQLKFKGFAKLNKQKLIELMLKNENMFKHLENLKPENIKNIAVKPKGKIQKERAENKPIKEKLKKEPTEYVRFVKKYRMDNNLSLKQAMKEIKEKGLYKAKTPAKLKKKLSKDEEIERANKLSRIRIKKKLVEYMKTVTDDPATRDKTQFLKLKKIIGKKTPVQKKKRLMIREKLPKLYNKLKELNFFEDIDLDKEDSKQIKKVEKVEKIDPNDFSYLGITNEEAEELLGIKKKSNKSNKPETLTMIKQKLNKLNILLNDLEDSISNFPKNRNDDENNKRIKLLNKKADLLDNIKLVKNKLRDMEDEDMNIDQFKIIVKKFIKQPTEKLNEEILDNMDLIEELSEKETDNLNKALDRFEEGDEEPTPAPKKKNKPKIKLVTFYDTKKEPKKTTNKVIQLIDNYNKLNKKYQEYAKLAYKKTYDGFKDIDFDRKENEISKFEKLIKEGKLTEKEIIDKVMTKQYSNTYGQRLPLSYFYNATLMTVVRRTDNFLAEEFNKMENTLKDLLYYNKPSQGLRINLATEGSTVANPNTLKDVEQNKERLLNSLQENKNKFETQLDRVREVENFKKDIIENFNFYNTKVTYNKTKIPDRVSKAFDKYKEIKDNSEEILDKYIEKYKKGKLFKNQKPKKKKDNK